MQAAIGLAPTRVKGPMAFVEHVGSSGSAAALRHTSVAVCPAFEPWHAVARTALSLHDRVLAFARPFASARCDREIEIECRCRSCTHFAAGRGRPYSAWVREAPGGSALSASPACGGMTSIAMPTLPHDILPCHPISCVGEHKFSSPCFANATLTLWHRRLDSMS